MTKHMFISKRNHWFSKAAFLMTFFQFGIVSWDTYLRMVGPLSADIVKLQTLFPFIVDAGIVVFLIFAFQLPKNISFKAFLICVLLSIFAILQFLLNHMMMSANLQSLLTLSHFLINMIMLSLFWWLSRMTNSKTFSYSFDQHRKFRIFTWIGFFLIFLEIALGGWIRTVGADAVCTDFPLCNGKFFAEFDWKSFVFPFDPSSVTALMTFNMVYRLGVIVISIYMMLLSFGLVRSRQFSEMGLLLFVLLVTQLTLGFINIQDAKTLWITMSFDAAITIILLLMISLLLMLYRKPEDNW